MTRYAGQPQEGATVPRSSRRGRTGALPRARTHQHSGETGARPGLQLALATLALAVEELLRDRST